MFTIYFFFFISLVFTQTSYPPAKTLCWDDKTFQPLECPFGLFIEWISPPPVNLDIGKKYSASYMAHTFGDLPDSLINCSHANIHICVSDIFCTPFTNNSLLQTVEFASQSPMGNDNSCNFTSEIPANMLTAGNKTIIAHVKVAIDDKVYTMAIGDYHTFYKIDPKTPIWAWLIPVIIIPAVIIIALIIVYLVRRRHTAERGNENIPVLLQKFFDIQTVRSKYTLDSNSPKVYKYKIGKQTVQKDLLDILIQNLDFRDISISESYAIYPEALVQSFFIRRALYQQRLKSGPGNIEFFCEGWKRNPKSDKRTHVMDQFFKKVLLWPWNEGQTDLSEVPILAMAHGTDLDVAWKITRGGFVALQKLDSGFYGRGIYLTSSAWYTAQYFVNKPNPCIVICLVLPGNPFPVIEAPKNVDSLVGKDIIEGYQSHYVITGIHGLPVSPNKPGLQFYDELVVQGEEQVLPIFVLVVDKTNLAVISQMMTRELEPHIGVHSDGEDDDEDSSLLGRKFDIRHNDIIPPDFRQHDFRN